MQPPDRKTAAILLAAGLSQRFGTDDKLTADFRGRPLWQHAAAIAERVDVDERYLVVSADAALGERDGWTFVVNTEAAEGMGTSIAAGVRAAPHCERIVIMLADMPLMTTEHITALMNADGPVFTQYDAKRRGCPAAFPRRDFAKLTGLRGNGGARQLSLDGAQSIPVANLDSLLDIDTATDLASIADQH